MPRIVRVLLRAVMACVVVLLVAYAADSLVFALRGSPAASVTVRPYLAVPRKDARVEFMFEDPRPEACARALFPHAGQPPCWYLRRHTDQRTNI